MGLEAEWPPVQLPDPRLGGYWPSQHRPRGAGPIRVKVRIRVRVKVRVRVRVRDEAGVDVDETQD